jgi:hypothetical protein
MSQLLGKTRWSLLDLILRSGACSLHFRFSGYHSGQRKDWLSGLWYRTVSVLPSSQQFLHFRCNLPLDLGRVRFPRHHPRFWVLFILITLTARRRRQHSSPKRWYSPKREWWQLINNSWNCKVFQLARCLQISVKWRVCFDTPLDWTSSECMLMDIDMTTPEEFCHFYVCDVPSFVPLPFTHGTISIFCGHYLCTQILYSVKRGTRSSYQTSCNTMFAQKNKPKPQQPCWYIATVRYWMCTFIHAKFQFCVMGLGSSVGIATRYWLDVSEIEYRWGRYFSYLSRPSLEPTQPPIQWVPGLFPPGVKRPGRGVDHPLLVPRLKKELSYTSTPLMGLSGLF